jgi:DNA-binding NarL/FixJ family response regulator
VVVLLPASCTAVRLAHTGVAQLDSSAVEHLASALARPVLPGPHDNVQEWAGDALTAREIDVVRFIAGGSTNRDRRAPVPQRGKGANHISRILSRLGLRDRTQAAVYARDHGLF